MLKYEGWYESNASNFCLIKCNGNNIEIPVDDSYIFCNYEATFLQSLHYFQHTFASVK
jgi:hypothetical protein